MDEKLTPELRQKLIEKIQNVVNADVLNVEDALVILEVCERAIKREDADITEQYIAGTLWQDEGKDDEEC